MSQWIVSIPGSPEVAADSDTLTRMAAAGVIAPSTTIIDSTTGSSYRADKVPGVFSPKNRWVALALSVLLGIFAADRFYLGLGGSGLVKLVTLAGFGVWWIVDIFLIGFRGVKDGSGRALA